MCGECSQCMGHTGFAPAHSSVCFLGLHCSGSRVFCRALSKVGPGLSHSGSCSQVLHKGTDLVGPVFCMFPRSEQLRQQGALWVHYPRCAEHLNYPPTPVQATRFPRWATRTPSQMCHVSTLGSWSQVATLLADVNCPGSQEDMVRNWEPVHSLMEDAGLWGWEYSSPLPSSLAVAPLPLCLWWGRAVCTQSASSPLVFAQSLFCEWARLRVSSLFTFVGKFSLSLFFFPLWQSHSLGCYLTLAPSDCPQGIQARSLPYGPMMPPTPPCPVPARWWQMRASGVLCW